MELGYETRLAQTTAEAVEKISVMHKNRNAAGVPLWVKKEKWCAPLLLG